MISDARLIDCVCSVCRTSESNHVKVYVQECLLIREGENRGQGEVDSRNLNSEFDVAVVDLFRDDVAELDRLSNEVDRANVVLLRAKVVLQHNVVPCCVS